MELNEPTPSIPRKPKVRKAATTAKTAAKPTSAAKPAKKGGRAPAAAALPANSTPGPAIGAEQKAAPPPAADVATMIAIAAYYLALQRGFAPGRELDDWLAAERSILDRYA